VRDRLANLARIYDAVGDRVSVFSSRARTSAPKATLHQLPKLPQALCPFHRQVNDWVHQHTRWKTFIHSCGSVVALLPDIIEAGFDILNPVQCSAAGMDPKRSRTASATRSPSGAAGLTPRRPPLGTPIRSQGGQERITIFNRGGGFVFNTVTTSSRTPVENLLHCTRRWGR